MYCLFLFSVYYIYHYSTLPPSHIPTYFNSFTPSLPKYFPNIYLTPPPNIFSCLFSVPLG
jgi:hypothetical protein